MKNSPRFCTFLTTALLCSFFSLNARDSVCQDPILEDLAYELHQLPSPPHFGARAYFLYADKAHIKQDAYEGQSIRYGEADIEGYALTYPSLQETLIFQAGYSNLTLDWPGNPNFSQTHFSGVIAGVMLTSSRWDNWFWEAHINNRFAPDEGFDGEYNWSTAEIRGRYSKWPCLGWQIGVIGQMGLERIYVYPIIGFDYIASNKWKINLIYPNDLSFVYTINDQWRLSFAGRLFKTRYRVSKKEPLSRGIFEHRNVGNEIALSWQYQSLMARAYAGSTLGGMLKMFDKSGNHTQTISFRPTLYTGMHFSLLF